MRVSRIRDVTVTNLPRSAETGLMHGRDSHGGGEEDDVDGELGLAVPEWIFW